MLYKIILLLFGVLLIFVGRRFVIHHWPYGKLIHVSGWVLCAIVVVLFLLRVFNPKK